MAGTSTNRIYNSGNSVASATVDGSQVTAFLEGVPLGVSATGEVFLKTGLTSSGAAGAPNIATAQVTAATTAGVLVAARATRRHAIVANGDGTNPIYIGVSTVATTTGFRVAATQSTTVETNAAISVISSGSGALVSVIEVYD